MIRISVTSKKLPNVYKSCPKMISLEKWKILTSLQKLPRNVGDLGQLITAKGFKKLPKSNKFPNLVTLFRMDHHNHWFWLYEVGTNSLIVFGNFCLAFLRHKKIWPGPTSSIWSLVSIYRLHWRWHKYFAIKEKEMTAALPLLLLLLCKWTIERENSLDENRLN